MKKVCFLCGKIKILLLCAILSTSLSAQFIETKFKKTGLILIPNFLKQIPFNSASLSNNRVRALNEDEKGDLWPGTTDGSGKFDSAQKQLVSNNDRKI